MTDGVDPVIAEMMGEIKCLRAEIDRLRVERVEMLAACRLAREWIALNTPMVDSSDPILGPIADRADAIRANLRVVIDRAESDNESRKEME